MKFMNFDVSNWDGLTPAQIHLATQTEMMFNTQHREHEDVYVFMINPQFMVQRGNRSYITSRAMCVFPEISYVTGRKFWSAMIMDDDQKLKPHTAGDLGRVISFEGDFAINEDLDELLKEVGFCCGASDTEELAAKHKEWHDMHPTFEILPQEKKTFQVKQPEKKTFKINEKK